MTSHPAYRLKVQQVDRVCLFELTWGQGQQLSTRLAYPDGLSSLYLDWQRSYLSFYKTAQMPLAEDPDADYLRGYVAASGSIAHPSADWHGRLVQAEATLLYEFHRWLRSADLFEIRAKIAQASRSDTPHQPLDLFLTCTPLELARFPWEAWEIGTEFASAGTIRIVRTPANIRTDAGTVWQRQGRARILAILGDDTGLDCQADYAAVQSLARVADVQFVGWRPGQTADEAKVQIQAAIADQQGWDILFFAGHSNETLITGGELAIAPHVSMMMSEIAPQLVMAKQRGLKFAIFNSCSGLSIAETLIDLGLSQVAVMREPIHDRVAHAFLMQFLQSLGEHRDVHESLLAACQFLKLERQVTDPSAYLIPSLFRHPDAALFRIEPFGWKQWLKQLAPTRIEAVFLLALGLISWQLPVQNWLLEQRVWMQAIYRDRTQQVDSTPAPILLVQIDNKSVTDLGKSVSPMDRRYLAQLVDRMVAVNSKVIGIDYLLDRRLGPDDQILARSIQTASDRGSLVILTAKRDDDGTWSKALPEFAARSWQGDLRLLGTRGEYLRLLLTPAEVQNTPDAVLPLGYLLALAQTLTSSEHSTPLTTQNPLQLTVHLFTPRMLVQPITTFSYGLKQRWFRPIVDFSMPPTQVYQRISAQEFLQQPIANLRQNHPQSLMMIVGGHEGNEPTALSGDNFATTAATRYWRDRQTPIDLRQTISGGEIHAYVFYNYLNRRLVLPIPDLWLIGVAILLGKGITLILHRAPPQQWQVGVLAGATVGYGWLSLQLYLSAAIALPWLLPTVTVWFYVLSPLIRSKARASI